MLIGILISFPIGPLGLLCVQRAIRKGFFCGYISGLGASLSDLSYGLLILFSFDFVETFIHKDNRYVNLILATVFFLLGIKLIMKKDVEIEDEFLHPAISAYFIGISNMGTSLIYLTIFTYFPRDLGLENFYYSFKILLFILLGANFFWFILCKVLSSFNKSFKVHHFVILDKIIGLTIIAFATFNFIKFITKF